MGEAGDGGQPASRLTPRQAEALRVAMTELMQGRFFDLLIGRLHSKFPRHKALAEDAVAQAVEQLALRHETIREVEPWLWTVSLHELGKLARRADRYADLGDLPDGEVGDPSEEVLVREAFRVVRQAVQQWDNKRIRVVTLLYLEAAVEMVRLDRAGAARLASEILGEPINPESVSQWRKRGFRDLRRMLQELGDDGAPSDQGEPDRDDER